MISTTTKGLIPAILLALLSFIAVGQDSDTLNPDDMTLEKLLETKISIGSAKELSPNESPGFVTIISHKEIEESGARDLVDLLRLVPGFDIALDVQGVMGIGLRGLWAHEGKILLMYNGHEMNESMYATLQLGNHYPVENIERIEIIRDPGSVLYGGVAEYSVINIVTRKANDKKELSLGTSYGFTSKNYGHRAVNLFGGLKNNAVDLNLSGKSAEAIPGAETYNDLSGNSYDMSKEHHVKNNFINADLTFKGFELKALYDNYVIKTRDGYSDIISKPYSNINNNLSFILSKPIKINNRLSIFTTAKYRNQTPWQTLDEATKDEMSLFHQTSQKITGQVSADYDIMENFNLLTGIEYLNENTKNMLDVFTSTGNSTFKFDNYALFAQALFRQRNYTLVAGARYNINSIFESSFVPRFGLTKIWRNSYAKLLVSKSFKTPSSENILLSENLMPENTTIQQIVFGHNIDYRNEISLALYNIDTKSIIIYSYDDVTNTEGYKNFAKTGSQGLEAEFKHKLDRGSIGLNYSFYSYSNKDVIEAYEVPQNKDVVLAFPAHKVNAFTSYNFSEKVGFYLSGSFYGPAYSQQLKENENNELEYAIAKTDPTFIANASLNFKNILTRRLTINLSVHNIGNSKTLAIQPYNSEHASLPYNSREVTLKLKYELNSK